MKAKIEEALHCLIGLPLWNASRAADLESFQLGTRHIVPSHRGGTKEVGDYALHVQCAWRIVGAEGIVVASRDRYYPAGNPDEDPPDFEWYRSGTNRCDEQVAMFFKNKTNTPLVVEAIQADPVGSLRLTLNNEFALEVFPDDSLAGEHWRLFQPFNDNDHFVVTGLAVKLN